MMVRENTSGQIKKVSPAGFKALQTLPNFMDGWAQDATNTFGPKRILTATINVTDGCPIGGQSFCGHYCFAHRSWDGSAIRAETPENYVHDAKKLRDMGMGVSIFLSTDTEPVPGRGPVADVTYRLLMSMVEHPPDGILVHTHTDVLGDGRFLDVMRALSGKTNLIAGIGFDTDTDNVRSPLHGHFSSVEDRMKAFAAMARSGIKTQASVTPLVGFVDFEGFGRRFKDMGAFRVMIGELRKEFPVGGSEIAKSLDLGLPAPTEEHAKAFFDSLGFPGGVARREDFYVLLP